MVYLMTPQTSKKKNTSKFKVFVSLIILMLLLLFAWLQESMGAEKVQAQPYMTDVEHLWEWSEHIYTDGAASGAWYFRWDAVFSVGGLDRLANALFVDHKGVAIPKIVRQSGDIIEGEGKIDGSNVIISRVESRENDEAIVILLNLDHHAIASSEQLQAAVEEIAALIKEEDYNAQFSMKVIGEAEQKDAMNDMLKLTVGQLIEQYEDEGTVSKTIFTPQLNNYIWLNEERMANMQISVHEHSQTKINTITLGVPLISGEFGETTTKNNTD